MARVEIPATGMSGGKRWWWSVRTQECFSKVHDRMYAIAWQCMLLLNGDDKEKKLASEARRKVWRISTIPHGSFAVCVVMK